MKKNKGFIVGFLLVLLSVLLFLFISMYKTPLKSEKLTIEYGEEIAFEIKNCLQITDPKILDKLVIDYSKVDFEDGKDYPKVGEHNLVITYPELFRTKSKIFTLVVADTTAPVFITAPGKIEFRINEEEPEFFSYFEVEDLSNFDLIIDTDLVNYEEKGTYDAKAIAKDIYGNQAEHNFSVIVEEEKKDEINNSVNIVPGNQVIPMIKDGILVVNKKHPLPANYAPGEDPKAVDQLNKMINEMKNLGYDISNDYSGFRTYDYQKKLYQRYVNDDGKEAADTYSARPGYSEHQTGLTFDLKHLDGTLVTKEAEAHWIAENAANYGFIVRYQVGKEHITGYQAEPWHLRYIGDEAVDIYNSGLTLEEYLGLEGGDYYNE